MRNELIAIWILAAALVGAVLFTPMLFLDDVIGGALLFALVTGTVLGLFFRQKA